MNNLGSQLTDLGKLRSGKLNVEPRRVSLATLFQQLEDQYSAQAKDKGTILRVAPTTVFVWSDEVLLRRIVSNLLSNALKYTDQGVILVGCRHHSTRIEIQVWDTGPGISNDNQKRLFTEYERLASSDGTEGLGLGLSIVRQLCELLDHKIHLHKSSPSGSCFSVQVKRD